MEHVRVACVLGGKFPKFTLIVLMDFVGAAYAAIIGMTVAVAIASS